MPVACVLSGMECKGICLDTTAYARHKGPLQRRQEEVSLPSTSWQLLLRIKRHM